MTIIIVIVSGVFVYCRSLLLLNISVCIYLHIERERESDRCHCYCVIMCAYYGYIKIHSIVLLCAVVKTNFSSGYSHPIVEVLLTIPLFFRTGHQGSAQISLKLQHLYICICKKKQDCKTHQTKKTKKNSGTNL